MKVKMFRKLRKESNLKKMKNCLKVSQIYFYRFHLFHAINHFVVKNFSFLHNWLVCSIHYQVLTLVSFLTKFKYRRKTKQISISRDFASRTFNQMTAEKLLIFQNMISKIRRPKISSSHTAVKFIMKTMFIKWSAEETKMMHYVTYTPKRSFHCFKLRRRNFTSIRSEIF